MQLIRGACKERVVPIGRLDRDSTGLLMFTNDGEMAKRLTHPKVGVRNLYHASFKEKVSQGDLDKMLEGFELDGKFVKFNKAINYCLNFITKFMTGNIIIHKRSFISSVFLCSYDVRYFARHNAQ